MGTLTSTEPQVRCQSCGVEIPADSESCPSCHTSLQHPAVRLPLTLVIALLFAVFALTQYFVRLHRGTEEDLAQRWFERGNQAMKNHNPAWAADGFRTALSYDRDNPEYRLRLAEALLESNHLNEARAHLTSLWEKEPADGEVNLELARLYAKKNLPKEAVRYYRNAVNGVWKQDPVAQREAARFELVQYLMQRRDLGQATAELMALQADEPRDISAQLRMSDLFLKLGEPSRAIEVYNAILDTDHGNIAALLGLGNAFLAKGDYQQAEHAFASAVEHAPTSAEARQQLELTREVLRVSPNLRDLSFAERARRVAAAFNKAWRRLMSCAMQHGYGPPAATPAEKPDGAGAANISSDTPALLGQLPMPPDLVVLYRSGLQMAPEATEQSLRKNPDSLEPVMQYVFQVERATAPLCSDMSPADRALLLLAQHENESLQ